MASAHNLLALDLGAESGRGILGHLANGRITLDVLHRFPNGPVKIGNRLYWDALRLFAEMKAALALAVGRGPLASLGVDTWGVDFAFFDQNEELLGNPRHYRDPHTEPVMQHILTPLTSVAGNLSSPLSLSGRGAGGEGFDDRIHPASSTTGLNTSQKPLTPNPSPREGEGNQSPPLSPGGRGAGGEGNPSTASFIFQHTGLQFLRFNSLFQLIALQQAQSVPLQQAKKLLFMPDLFHAWFSGVTANEASIASTSQCYNPQTGDWAWPLIDHYQLPRHLFGKIVPAGARLGSVLPSIRDELGISYDIPVLAPASHDTAAAVAAVPAQGDDWCYLSSGTWSLMGVELPAPVINDAVQAANFTNEGGVQGTTRFLKNIMGMWLVQECKRSFAHAQHDYNYDELVKLAEAATPFASIINPDDASFLLPRDMPTAIADFCRRTGQPVPATPGAFIRCCLESLALRYRWTKEKLTQLTSKRLNHIHIVGGGCQNRLLNQFTADATNCVVLAGPVEATALGNLLTQAMGLGLVSSLDELRSIVRQSFALERFEPRGSSSWDAVYQRFLGLLG